MTDDKSWVKLIDPELPRLGGRNLKCFQPWQNPLKACSGFITPGGDAIEPVPPSEGLRDIEGFGG